MTCAGKAGWWLGLAGFLCSLALANAALAGPPRSPEALPPVLSLDEAVRWALANNPELAAVRQQRGIAQAGLVIARTYPFNPIMENRIQQASGPFSASITNVLPLEHLLLLELEVRGQRGYRQQAANATLSRTEWEIVFAEQTLAARVIRAFYTVLYRQEKLALLERTVQLDQQLLDYVERLIKAGKATAADRITAQTEIEDARQLFSAGRTALIGAQFDLRRVLGVVDGSFEIQGTLQAPSLRWDVAGLLQAALERRADLRARQAAVAEAEAIYRLAVANRYGNPTFGPAFTYDPTRISSGGVQINFPIPVLNSHQGDILQRQAERTRAYFVLRQTEVLVRQDLQAALGRLASAQTRAEAFRSRTLPVLNKALDDIRQLPGAGVPGVGALQILDVQRKLLRAQDSYLDTLYEVSQARADLFVAAGGLAIVAAPAKPPEDVETLPPLRPKP